MCAEENLFWYRFKGLDHRDVEGGNGGALSVNGLVLFMIAIYFKWVYMKLLINGIKYIILDMG